MSSFYEVVKVVKPVKAGLNHKWELWKQAPGKDAMGNPAKVLVLVDSLDPEMLPPHVRKAMRYDTRAHFAYGKQDDKHFFGKQASNHRW